MASGTLERHRAVGSGLHGRQMPLPGPSSQQLWAAGVVCYCSGNVVHGFNEYAECRPSVTVEFNG